MISLKISEDWKKRFVQEMYANDKYYDEFIDDDIVRAYYFGFFIQDVCEEMQSDGFKTGEPDEQLTPMKWAVRRYKPQLVFWKKKYVDTYGEMVILSEMDAYILNKIVVDSDDDLLRIATCLGRDSYLLVSRLKNRNLKYRIYTDGAYSSALNQGGVGVVFVKEVDGKLTKIAEVSKGYKNTTNNRMELKAIIIAFKCITAYIEDVTIISDSMYAIGTSRIGSIKYKRNTNLDVLQELDNIVKEKRSLIGNLHIEWVKGHYEDEFNARADKIAVDASQQLMT